MDNPIVVTTTRELSLLVAEKVIGWQDLPAESFGGWLPNRDFYHPTKGASANWKYATDIAAAWEVAQLLGLAVVPQSRDSGFDWFACDLESVLYDGDIHLVEKNDSGSHGETAPIAICLAALRSLGFDIDWRGGHG